MAQPPLPKRILVPPTQKVPKKSELFPAPTYKIRKKILAPQKKYLWLGGGRVYTMENKDTKTDYQKLVRAEDQKCKMVEITIGMTFVFIIFYIYSKFSSPT